MTRQVWQKGFQIMVEMPFLRLNLIDDYNNGMHDVYLADQVQSVYQWNLYIRKWKWWRLTMMWCLQMIQSNAYIWYKKYVVMPVKQPISNFDFFFFCLNWIDTDNYWPKKKQMYQSCSSDSASTYKTRTSRPAVTSTSNSIIKRDPKSTDKPLCTLFGNLCMCLHECEPHWPVRNMKQNTSCLLHLLVIGPDRKLRSNLTNCSFCKVTLCVSCFVPFHNVPHLNNIKRSLAIQLHSNEEEE